MVPRRQFAEEDEAIVQAPGEGQIAVQKLVMDVGRLWQRVELLLNVVEECKCRCVGSMDGNLLHVPSRECVSHCVEIAPAVFLCEIKAKYLADPLVLRDGG